MSDDLRRVVHRHVGEERSEAYEFRIVTFLRDDDHGYAAAVLLGDVRIWVTKGYFRHAQDAYADAEEHLLGRMAALLQGL